MSVSHTQQLTPDEINAMQEGLTATETSDLYAERIHPADAHDALEKIWDPDYKPAPYSLAAPEWYISISAPFARAIKQIDHRLQRHIFVALSQIGEKPMAEDHKHVVPLSNQIEGCWSYMIEDHRIIYHVNPDDRSIVLLSFTSSKEQQA